jgi:hypothetical protein
MYSSQEQSMHFTYITNLQVEEKQAHTMQTKDISNKGTLTASYKVLRWQNSGL